MNNELAGIWKEAARAYFKSKSPNLLRETKENKGLQSG